VVLIVDKIDRFLKITQEKNGIRESLTKRGERRAQLLYHEANTGLCISLWKDLAKKECEI